MRTLLKFVLFAVLSTSAYAKEDASQVREQVNPVKDVTPFVEADKRKVIIFFKFNCPFCRSYHASLAAWGKSLPKGISYQFNPVFEGEGAKLISDNSLYALQAFWVAERLGTTAQKEAFADEAYSIAQDELADADRERWFRSLEGQGLKPDSIISAWRSEISLGDSRLERQLHYKPEATPSLVVCGRWMVSTEATQGNQALFSQLINGLVSRCASSLGIKRN